MGKKRLGHDINVESWFQRGSNFYIAYLRLMREPQLMLQAIVLCAFVIETYLKILKAVEGEARPLKEHNLLDLFDDLSDASKDAMDAHWVMIFHETLSHQAMLMEAEPELAALFEPRTMRNALHEAQEAFVSFRYGADENPTGPITTGFGAFAMPDILLSQILGLRPDLDQIRQKIFALLKPEVRQSEIIERHYQRPRYSFTFGNIPQGQ